MQYQPGEGMREEEKAEISAAEVKEYLPKQIIVSEGQDNKYFYVILKGEVEISQNDKTIRIIKEGDVFGLENFYLKRPYTTTSRALTHARIASYPSHLIKEIIYHRPQLAEIILNSVMNQLEQTTQVAEENISIEGYFDINEHVYEDGEIIIEEGSTGVDFYKLIETEGGLLVTKEGKEVGKITKPGEYFGEMSSLLDQRRTATIRSIGRSVVQVFPGDNLETILMSYPDLAKKIIDTLAHRLSGANKKIAELGSPKTTD
jgi:CRP-like cAMP-binding protein